MSHTSSLVATLVRPASIDRMTWRAEVSTGRVTRRGSVDAIAIACGRVGTLHRASAADGGCSYVLRGAPETLRRRAADQRLIADLRDTGFDVPTIQRVDAAALWLERLAWADPRDRFGRSAVEHYVCAVLHGVLTHGAVIATGTPHLAANGGIVVEDTFVAARLETDERHAIRALWCALLDLDAVAVADALGACSGLRTPELTQAARRATLSLRADWSAAAVGLSFRHLALATISAGIRSEPLVLLADELLHRLDLAWATGCTVAPLASAANARAWFGGAVAGT